MGKFMSILECLLPTRLEAIVLAVSSAVCGWVSFAIGGIDLPLQWLFIFALVDYVTGTIAAGKAGNWTAKESFTGLLKKVSIFVIVMICHGIDVVSHVDFMRSSAILALSLTEAGSVFENIEAMGYGYLIPDFLKKGLKKLQNKTDKIFEGTERNDKTNRH